MLAPPSISQSASAVGDSVATYRREVKFILPQAWVPHLVDQLAARVQPVRFGRGDVSQVNSLYFDDDRLSSCEESLAGVSRRIKLRLRWYDNPWPTTDPIFEVKQRNGTVITKQRLGITLPDALERIPTDRVSTMLIDRLPEIPAALLALRSRPTLLITYRRRHFRDLQISARLTVDDQIIAYDQTRGLRLSRRFSTFLQGIAVMEMKADPSDNDSMRRMLGSLRLRPTRSSKYVSACGLMNWCWLGDHA